MLVSYRILYGFCASRTESWMSQFNDRTALKCRVKALTGAVNSVILDARYTKMRVLHWMHAYKLTE